MKILLLTSVMNPDSGSGRCAVDLVAAIRNAGHQVIVLKETDDGYEGAPILKRRSGIFRSAYLVRGYAKSCDVIHALDGYPYGIIGALANIGLRKRLVITAIGTYSVEPLYRWRTAMLVRWAYRRASHVFCISRYTQSQIERKMGPIKSSVVNLGIDTKMFDISHKSSEEVFLLSVGAVKFRKGYETSIRAFNMLKPKYPNIKYKIVGGLSDSYAQQLRNLAEELGVADDVQFLGEVSDDELRALYALARLFILTSVNQGHHFEGFGLVFLEAAAAGLPVIGTKDTGIEDAMKGGYNGVLVGQNDAQETERAIIRILEDEKEWRRMSENGRQWARAHDRMLMIQPYLNIYLKSK